MMLRQLHKEPMLHFFVLGACIFLAFEWLNRGHVDEPNVIVVDQSRIEMFTEQFERLWQRPPTMQETQDMVDNWIREEILYREGIALGLAADDMVIRRHIAQKMAFVIEDTLLPEPTDTELEAWYRANVEDFRIESIFSLRQVYIDPVRHEEDLLSTTEELHRLLVQSDDLPPGDSALLPQHMQAAHMSMVAGTFGKGFADAIADFPIGIWQGPIKSAYGLHFVQLQEKIPARLPALEEVRDAAVRRWTAVQTEAFRNAAYEAFRKQYSVRVEAETRSISSPAAAGSP